MREKSAESLSQIGMFQLPLVHGGAESSHSICFCVAEMSWDSPHSPFRRRETSCIGIKGLYGETEFGLQGHGWIVGIKQRSFFYMNLVLKV
jgi:hypothetical protein